MNGVSEMACERCGAPTVADGKGNLRCTRCGRVKPIPQVVKPDKKARP